MCTESSAKALDCVKTTTLFGLAVEHEMMELETVASQDQDADAELRWSRAVERAKTKTKS